MLLVRHREKSINNNQAKETTMLAVVVVVLMAYMTWTSFAFHIQTKPTRTQLMMGGGRSPEERQLSKRQMFHNIRNAFNEAAKEPGFFETRERPVVRIFGFFGKNICYVLSLTICAGGGIIL